MKQANSRSSTLKTKDPIFPLIKAQMAAERAHNAAVTAYSKAEASGSQRRVKLADARVAAASDACGKAMIKLCSTRPKTMAGLAALAAYVGKNYDCDYEDKRTQKIFVTLAAAILDIERRAA